MLNKVENTAAKTAAPDSATGGTQIALSWPLVFSVIVIKNGLLLWASYNFDFDGHPQNNWLNIWGRWDFGAYKAIAESGYGALDVGPDYAAFLSHFPPLYPLAMALVAAVLAVSLLHAGVLISYTAILAASWVLYRLVLLEFPSERIAFFSVLFLNIFPTSYFTIAPYAESLFLLFSITSFYCLRRGWLFLCGLAAGAALLTRIPGVVFIPLYLLYFLLAWRRDSKPTLKQLWPFLLSVLGFAIYLAINRFYFGDAWHFLTERESFHTTKYVTLPFQETFHHLSAILRRAGEFDRYWMMMSGWNAVFTAFALGVTLVGIRRLPWEYSAYALGSLIFFASFAWGISNARYTLAVFPMFVVLGQIKSRWVLGALGMIFVVLLLYFTEIFTSGWWAF